MQNLSIVSPHMLGGLLNLAKRDGNIDEIAGGRALSMVNPFALQMQYTYPTMPSYPGEIPEIPEIPENADFTYLAKRDGDGPAPANFGMVNPFALQQLYTYPTNPSYPGEIPEIPEIPEYSELTYLAKRDGDGPMPVDFQFLAKRDGNIDEVGGAPMLGMVIPFYL